MAYSPGITRRNYYPVNTFMTKTKSHYEKAVDYYESKQKAFINILTQQINNIGGAHSVQLMTFQGMLNNEKTQLDNTFFRAWSQMYNSHWNASQLQPALQKWNSLTQASSSSMMKIEEGVDLINYLIYSLNGANSSYISAPMYSESSLSNAQYIGTNQLTTLINAYTSAPVGNQIAEYNGQKALAFGELFELLAEGAFRGAVGDLFQVLNIGSARTGINFSGQGPAYTQGKTDTLLSLMPVTITNQNGRAMGTTNLNGKPITVSLDADQLIDLETTNSVTLQQIIQKKAGLAGISAKQWTLSPILNARLSASSVSRQYSASMGNFAITRNLANARQYYPEDGQGKITKYFRAANIFTQYTGYLVSRYLINIIGELNIFMMFGDQLMTTSHFLNSLYLKGQQGRRYVIAHKQKRASNGTGKDKGGRKKHDSKIYIADSGLVVAYVYDAADLV